MQRHVQRGPDHRDLEIEVEDGSFPESATCKGANLSPEIRINGLWSPYLALIMDDPDAHQGGFTHWTLWNVPRADRIPAEVPASPEVNWPVHGVQGRNSFGGVGYSGPCPPEGERHRYDVRVYGLDGPLDVPPAASREDLEKALSGRVIQYGQAQITFP